jgi:hypothetical protein
MTGFTRYFAAEPSRATLAAIEGVNLIEISPQNIEQGASTGVVAIIGEAEDGPYNTPIEIRSGEELVRIFGELGYIHDGKPGQSPVARRSGGSELWNGNLYMALAGLSFGRLIIVRVRTASGQVRFQRLASMTATLRGPHNLEPGDVANFEVDGSPVQAIIVAVAGTIQAVGGTYPTNFVGTEKMTIRDEFGNDRIVKFAVTDQAIADVIDAINKQLGYDAASNVAGQILLTSRIRGSKGYIQVVSASPGVLAQLGFSAVNTAEVDKVTVVTAGAGAYTFSVTVLYQGQLTLYTGTFTAVAENQAAIRAALIANFNTVNPLAPVTLAAGGAGVINITSNVAGVGILTAIVATPNVGDFTTANVTPNATNYGWGNGNVKNTDGVLDAEIVKIFDLLGGLGSRLLSTGFLRAWNTTTPETGTLKFVSGTLGTTLGFVAGTTVSAGDGASVLLPSGTRVQDDAGFTWVTCQTYETDKTGGPFDLDVRPAMDDDSTPTASIGEVNVLVDVMPDEFVVSNTVALTRLSPSAIDKAYRTALDRTVDSSSVAREITIITTARGSESIDASMVSNVPEANKEEHALRVGILSAPLGFSVEQRISDTAQGVPVCGKGRDYVFMSPGHLANIPRVAEVGLAGGLGFTADGVVERRSNVLYASIRSLLPPEENAGQDLTRTSIGRIRVVVGLENAFNSAKGGTPLKSNHYIAMAAAGICTIKIDPDAGVCIQSDLTAKPASLNSDECNANHRFMWNYIANTQARIAKPYLKTLKKPGVRGGLVQATRGFLEDLKSEGNPSLARILDFTCEDTSSAPWEGLGHTDVAIGVQLLPVQKFINLRFTLTTQGLLAAA